MNKNKDGIVVRGAKINISGAFASHELVVLPQAAHFKGEEDYALAFAILTDTKGITYVCQYSPYSAERDMADDLEELGNPVFGQRETSMVIFDNVFVPWDRIFHCGEYKYSIKYVARFARTHRMTCGGTCKVGFMNQIIGASRLIQEYKGIEKAAHINDELMEMVVLRETGRACGLASAQKGTEEPEGSGVFLPKVHKLLQNWTAGQHGVGTWHGAGPVMAQKIMLQRLIDYEHEKDIVKQTLKLAEKKE
ncbi:MAG: 4-hydroxyphenylacetate 3-hydroxylase N-terminal domain-containing protein [Thermodesulfobacteriota bacterium]|nr:4-hydroxyphenylacetate 3-hydroxylase N-terminal domain-containing protein [Thermodesulfobacteriota bacterium]